MSRIKSKNFLTAEDAKNEKKRNRTLIFTAAAEKSGLISTAADAKNADF